MSNPGPSYLWGSHTDRSRPTLLPIVLAVPPSAAERLEQRRGIGVARRLRLHAVLPRLQVDALGIQQLQVADAAHLVLQLRHVEGVLRIGLGNQVRLQRARI